MKKKLFLFISLMGLLAAMLATGGRAQNGAPGNIARREVAVTFDDLPSPQSYDLAVLKELTAKLLRSIAFNHVPAIGFVNESKLHERGELEARTAILKMWLDAGLELGNHTYSHVRFYTTPLAQYEAEVMHGETVTKKLLAERGMKLRYFRHPTLNTGPNLETKHAFEKFLAAHQYTVAPVTIDNSDWIFARVYAEAREKGDHVTMQRVAEAYVPYLAEVFAFYEQLSRDALGYEVKQTLLLHANALNADYFDDIAHMLKRRGYAFISLDQALTDKAYSLPDNYIGPVGISWLQRWAITKGLKFRPEPGLPEVMQPYDTPASGSDFKTGKRSEHKTEKNKTEKHKIGKSQ
jgi:peptidoglycan/xylan/chitin deacetylase (PgdA/CDA1 family)